MDAESRQQQRPPEAEQEPQAEPQASESVLPSLSAQDILNMLPGGQLGMSDPAPRILARVSSLSKSSEGAGVSSSSMEQTPQEREAMTSAWRRGDKLMKSQLFGEAATTYTEALRLARSPQDVAGLLASRSEAYASLSRSYRTRPARRSECAALFDLDPTSLAHLALRDADRALGVRPGWAEGYERQGAALFLLERYPGAREAFLEGLALEPTRPGLQAGLREVMALLSGDTDTDNGTPPPPPAPPAAAAAAAAAAGTASTPTATATDPPAPSAAAAATNSIPFSATTTTAAATTGSPSPITTTATITTTPKRQRTLPPSANRSALDEWDCPLCAKLLFEPVTTPCGHTFCRECFARAVDHRPRCPCCRTVIHVSRDALPLTVTLASIIGRAFPEEYEERRREAAGGGGQAAAAGAAAADSSTPSASLTLPLFVMCLVLPGESISLNIFEPRYRLLVRRVMEGSRRLGMVQARRDAAEIEDVAVEAEIVECQPQPDGRYYLELVGRRRVRITGHSELDGYRVARCELLQDSEPQPGTQEHNQLPELLEQVGEQADAVLTQLRSLAATNSRLGLRVRGLLEGLGERPPPSQPERFSMWAATIACSLLPDLDKAAVLRGTDTAQRLRQLQGRLGALRMAGGAAGGAAGGPQSCCVM